MSYPVVLSSRAVADVVGERERQVIGEGFDAAHDDQHSDGSLAMAAVCYAIYAVNPKVCTIPMWPRSWHPDWWRPKNPRRDLVRAAALLIAEIERLDRDAEREAEASHG